jgi:hypothetical protein
MVMLRTSQPLLKTQGVFGIEHFFPETLPENVCQTINSNKLLKLAHSQFVHWKIFFLQENQIILYVQPLRDLITTSVVVGMVNVVWQ